MQESWFVFKDHLLQVPTLFIPSCRKSSKGGRISAQLKNKNLTKLKMQRRKHKRSGSTEEYLKKTKPVQAYMYGFKKSKLIWN